VTQKNTNPVLTKKKWSNLTVVATNHQNKVIFNHRRELHVFCILDYIFKEVIFPSERLETEYVDFSTK